MKILYFNYTTTSLASLLRSLEYGKAAANQGNQVTLCYLHPSFQPPKFYYALMESYQSKNFQVHYPNRFNPTLPVLVVNADDKHISARPQKKVIGKVVDAKPTLKGLFRQIITSFRFVPAELKWVKEINPDVLLVRPDQMISFMWTSRVKHVPLVLECDGPVEELDQYWGLNSKWVEPIDTWRAKKAGAVLYISKPCLDLWRKKEIPAAKLFYTPNAAHPEKWKPLAPEMRARLREKLGLGNSIVIGFSGNLRSWHGVNLLLEAALPLLAVNSELKILFVGAVDDPGFLAQQNVPQKIREKQFVFTGPLEYNQMGNHIDLADCIVIPYAYSNLFYFSPMKLFEAMCLGKLIVAPRMGQIAEMLGGLKSPILYNPTDPKALQLSLEKALERINSKQENEVLGADARTFIEAEHTWEHRGKTVVEACQFAIRAASPRLKKI